VGPGDLISIPPCCAHKRFNAVSTEARVVVINSRIMKAIGFDWFDRLEPEGLRGSLDAAQGLPKDWGSATPGRAGKPARPRAASLSPAPASAR
jgi:hypothetical protein